MTTLVIQSNDYFKMAFEIQKWFTENYDKALISIVIVPDNHKFITTITFVECDS
jgi:hypothetical protein